MKKKKKWYGIIKAQAGVTLAEITVVVGIISVLSLIFYSLVIGTMRTNILLEAENSLNSYGQRTINMLKSEVAQSRRLYENNSDDNALRNRIIVSSDISPISTSRLLIIDSNATDPNDVADANIGNSLFFLMDRAPFKLEDTGTSPPTVIYIIDLHQFIYYYINEKNAGGVKIGSKTNYMDLMKFQSKPYANYQQLIQAQSNLSSSEWNALTGALVAAGIQYCVDLDTSDVNNIFYEISGGNLNSQSSHNIQEERAKPAIPIISGVKVTGNIRYSVAYNKASDFDIFEQVPKYCTDTTIPFGFEVVVIGGAAALQVTVRLVLAAGLQRQIRARANDVTVHARSF